MGEHIPALTLIFSHDGEDGDALTSRLLDLDDVAIDAIEKADSSFSILKSFTFLAGKPYENLSEQNAALRAMLKKWNSGGHCRECRPPPVVFLEHQVGCELAKLLEENRQ